MVKLASTEACQAFEQPGHEVTQKASCTSGHGNEGHINIEHYSRNVPEACGFCRRPRLHMAPGAIAGTGDEKLADESSHREAEEEEEGTACVQKDHR
eukprot:4234515-Amphidinium_carterae.1